MNEAAHLFYNIGRELGWMDVHTKDRTLTPEDRDNILSRGTPDNDKHNHM